MKYRSGQALLQPHVLAHGRLSLDALPEQEAAAESINATPLKYVRLTSITQDVITQAALNDQGSEAPVHALLLLEAIEAITHRDLKKAVLFSAIAVEVLAQTQIRDAYERLKLSSPNPSEMRFIDVQPKKGTTTIREDPVFELLMGRAKGQAERLFHEVALYVLGRSMHTEDLSLYELNTKLRDMRNRIAHKDLKGKSSKLCLEDATLALDCANRTFRWFNAEDYPLPEEVAQVSGKPSQTSKFL
ncbi:MAG TPA: hypothetical protein VGS22_21090 [Thermoanaerobaculia bacterium]|nr:hypothetical protein [Thermoanaerobaculia bacterium]